MKQSPCHGFDYGNVSLLVLASFFFYSVNSFAHCVFPTSPQSVISASS